MVVALAQLDSHEFSLGVAILPEGRFADSLADACANDVRSELHLRGWGVLGFDEREVRQHTRCGLVEVRLSQE